jgi:NADPH:quinone reductase
MMQAVVVAQPGGLDVLELRNVAEPAPASQDVVIAVAAASVNWGDVQKRQGIYPDPVTYPATLGMEVAGRIVAVGTEVPDTWVGRRVSALCGPKLLGGYAERVAVPIDYVLPLPDELSWHDAAAFPLAGLTAWHLLRSAASVGPGDTVLVHAISGSVGLALTQIGTALGATVIGTVGDAAKAATATSYGAALVIDRSHDDFVDAAMAFTAGRGVDLVVDSLGASILPRSFDALRTYGRVVNIGEAAGEPEFNVRKKLYERSTSLAGFEVLHARPGSDRWAAGVAYVLEQVGAGRLRIPVGQVRPLDRVADLHAALEGRATTGKLVMDIAPTLA